MGIDFEAVTGGSARSGGGLGSPGRKKLLLFGGIGVLLFIVFKKQSGGGSQNFDTPLDPQIQDMASYPTMDQQQLDQQFMNYTALVQQDFTNKFLTINDNLAQLQHHMDTNQTEIQNEIKNGLKNKIIESTKHTTPVQSHPKTTSAIKPVKSGTKYATPRGGWNSNSLTDYLKSKGYKNSLTDRKRLASQAGIKNYKGTATQNKQLLSKLKAL